MRHRVMISAGWVLSWIFSGIVLVSAFGLPLQLEEAQARTPRRLKELQAFVSEPSEKTLTQLKNACKKANSKFLSKGPATAKLIQKMRLRAEELDVEALFFLHEECAEGAAAEKVSLARRSLILRNPSAVIQKLSEKKSVPESELQEFATVTRLDEEFMPDAKLVERLQAASGAVESAKVKGRAIMIRARLHIMFREEAKKAK